MLGKPNGKKRLHQDININNNNNNDDDDDDDDNNNNNNNLIAGVT